jgi:hypothetical protein
MLCDTSSDQSFSHATRWLEDYISKHKVCSLDSSQPVVLPYRVLDVCPDGCSNHVKLLENPDHSAPYVCLSHCWGQSPGYWPLRTTRNNIGEIKADIPSESLTRTFQEVLGFVRRCIIQDDEADWNAQAKEMARIYENSFLTLAAAASTDSTPKFNSVQVGF